MSASDAFIPADLLDRRRKEQARRGDYEITAEQSACGRGEDGDPASAGAAPAPEPTEADQSGDGRACYPAPSRGRNGGRR